MPNRKIDFKCGGLFVAMLKKSNLLLYTIINYNYNYTIIIKEQSIKLLESASLSVNEKQIALIIADDLRHDSMELALKRMSLNIQIRLTVVLK